MFKLNDKIEVKGNHVLEGAKGIIVNMQSAWIGIDLGHGEVRIPSSYLKKISPKVLILDQLNKLYV